LPHQLVLSDPLHRELIGMSQVQLDAFDLNRHAIPHYGAPGRGHGAAKALNTAQHDAVDLEKQMDLLQRDSERRRDVGGALAASVHP
jgi:hypothetical protein